MTIDIIYQSAQEHFERSLSHSVDIFAPVFNSKSIPGLQLWLDASQISGLNDGDPVGQWNDLSGNGRDLAQGTTTNKPTKRNDSQGGKPGVEGDGVDDILSINLGSTIPISAYTTWLVAANPIGATGVRTILSFRRASTSAPIISFYFSDNTFNARLRNDSASLTVSTVAVDVTVPHAYIVTYDGINIRIYVDGVLGVTTPKTGTATIDQISAFAALQNTNIFEYLKGYTQEIGFSNSVYAGVTGLQSYLKTKWGTP